jgi:hypothetical protein
VPKKYLVAKPIDKGKAAIIDSLVAPPAKKTGKGSSTPIAPIGKPLHIEGKTVRVEDTPGGGRSLIIQGKGLANCVLGPSGPHSGEKRRYFDAKGRRIYSERAVEERANAILDGLPAY